MLEISNSGELFSNTFFIMNKNIMEILNQIGILWDHRIIVNARKAKMRWEKKKKQLERSNVRGRFNIFLFLIIVSTLLD